MEGLSSVNKEIDGEFLSDRQIDELLDFYRSAVGRRFVSLQHRLQPIVTKADAAAQAHKPPNPDPPVVTPSPEMVAFITLALSQQYWTSHMIEAPSGPNRDPAITAVALESRFTELDQMRREYLGDLKSFAKFRHSTELSDLLEASRIAYLLCETSDACAAGRAQ
jgi:hypothetical protein